jgi:hypothetical protein
MATKKKEVKVRDLKPSKDAKGGAARQFQGSTHRSTDGGSRLQGGTHQTQGSTRQRN